VTAGVWAKRTTSSGEGCVGVCMSAVGRWGVSGEGVLSLGVMACGERSSVGERYLLRVGWKYFFVGWPGAGLRVVSGRVYRSGACGCLPFHSSCVAL